MSDDEIKDYLVKHNWEVNAQDAVMDVVNTSPQIVKTEYDSDSGIMTLYTKDNVFRFLWRLKKFS